MNCFREGAVFWELNTVPTSCSSLLFGGEARSDGSIEKWLFLSAVAQQNVDNTHKHGCLDVVVFLEFSTIN